MLSRPLPLSALLIFAFAVTATAHPGGCFRTGNGDECCHAGPEVYHCH
jgi:hypothetical protein